MELKLELEDNEWPFEYTDHDRLIARAIVFDGEGFFYFVWAERDDDFGRATLIETAGGGVESGEDLEEAVRREVKEELGAEAEVICGIGTVSDYYNLIHRHNLNHYFLCRARSFGDRHLTPDEIESFHLSTLRLTFEEAEAEYEKRRETRLGRLVAARELPVLRRAKELIGRIREGRAGETAEKAKEKTAGKPEEETAKKAEKETVAYERLTADRVEEFIRIRVRQLREEGARDDADLAPALRDYYRWHMADGTFVSWIALCGGRIVGTSGMSFVEKPPYFACPNGRIGLLSGMYTHPEYRRRGIARELLRRVIAEARAYGCGTVQITASDMGVLLYTDFGFVKNGNFMHYDL